jgi:hypothetical protein
VRGDEGHTVIWDASDLLESQIAAMRDLPFRVPVLVILEMSAEDLAHLDAAADTPHYQSVLNRIVTRIQKGKQHE